MWKKYFFKILPYVVAISGGSLFYYIGFKITEYKELLTNISASFFALPLLFFFYETTRLFSHNKLNKEIFDYAKMQVDSEILSILDHLQKLVFSIETREFSSNNIRDLLELSQNEIHSLLENNKYLGFQIFKLWDNNEKNLHDLLKNTFILEKIQDEQIITIIEILKNIRTLDGIQKIKNIYQPTDEKNEKYSLIGTNKINFEPEFLDSKNKLKDNNIYLLLRNLKDKGKLVVDFGSIVKSDLNNCLYNYRINKEYVSIYSKIIFNFLKKINYWLVLTGSEFIVDEKMFRLQETRIGYKDLI